MGYTHYYKFRGGKLGSKAFNKLKEDFKTIKQQIELHDIRNHGAGGYYTDQQILLGDAWGEKGQPELTDKHIMFNGVAELSHETFALYNGEQKDWFCKTARKPYDLVVCLMLLSAKYHQAGTEVSSDGDLEDWAFAFDTWNKIFPTRTIAFEFAGDNITMIGSK